MPELSNEKSQIISRINKIYCFLKEAQSTHTSLSTHHLLHQTFTQSISKFSVRQLKKIEADLSLVEKIVRAEKNMLDQIVECIALYHIKKDSKAEHAAASLQRHVYALISMTQETINGINVLAKYGDQNEKPTGLLNRFFSYFFKKEKKEQPHTETFKKLQTFSETLKNFIETSSASDSSISSILFENSDYVVSVFDNLSAFLKYLVTFKEILAQWEHNQKPDPLLLETAHEIAYNAIQEATSLNILEDYPHRLKIVLDYFMQKEECVNVLMKFNQHLKEVKKLNHLPVDVAEKTALISKKLIEGIASILQHQMTNPKMLIPILEHLDDIFLELEKIPFDDQAIKMKVGRLIQLTQGAGPETQKQNFQAVRKQGQELLELISLHARNHPPELMNILRWHHQAALKELSADFTDDLFDLDEALDGKS